MSFRKLFLYAHLGAGLAAAVMLIVSSVSGLLLSFESELHMAINSKLMTVQPQGGKLALSALAEKLEAAQPDSKVTMLGPAIDAQVATLAGLRSSKTGKGSNVFVNPYTAEILGPQSAVNPFVPKVRAFHKNLLLGDKARWVTGWGAGLLMALALTGIVLWSKQKLLKFSATTSGARRNYEVHNIFGIWASIFLLITSATGLAVHWERDAGKYFNPLLGIPEATIKKSAPPAPGATPLSIDQIVKFVSAAVPGAAITSLEGIGGIKNPIKVRTQYPGDRTPGRRMTLLLDPVTGELLLSQPAVFKLWNQEVHTGKVLGWPTRVINVAVALTLPILAITGPLIWWRRFRKKNEAKAGLVD